MTSRNSIAIGTEDASFPVLTSRRWLKAKNCDRNWARWTWIRSVTCATVSNRLLVVCVLYNAATPLDSWNEYKDMVERARNKFEPPPSLDEEDMADRLGFTLFLQRMNLLLIKHCMEYVALFRVNRFQQSEVSEVNDMRYIEDVYVSLLEETYEIIKTAKATFNGNITDSIESLTQRLMDKANDMHRQYQEKIELLNCAYRSRLLDKLSWISCKSESSLKKSLLELEQSHKQTMSKLEKNILKGKKDSYDRASDITKFRNQVDKYTKLMRKHGIVDHDDYMSMDDEKIKTDNILDHYQKVLFGRQEKIKQMKKQMKELESILDSSKEESDRKSAVSRERTQSIVGSRGNRRQSSIRNTTGEKSKRTPSTMTPKIQETQETLMLLEETRSIYEEKINKAKEELMTKIIAERNDFMRLDQDLQNQYDDIIGEVYEDPEILDSIVENPILTKVERLFPVHIRPNMVSVEVTCDIETPPPLQLLKPLDSDDEDDDDDDDNE
ncbi:hypothetical protein BCR33DRAFT_860183 [Rhizoclosmatium globosum]|uniref:Uncharacterized protein n=1 Tax=Rhizoclosmatium globosum TaxID=329046 RepID=A0A1Y2AQ33_9FUNG|nr:hypothetical protein BCR33DRAFT_860183 [Rhizoclosmatium globosum]|eukprot:ORY24651.1 hypothetical protein BCR33DRAFT_860183 [Rhizoclosmatium globosum]